MKFRKALIVGMITSAAVVGLAGCNSVDDLTTENSVQTKMVTLPDGREVPCVFWKPYTSSSGGAAMVCDFGGAR